MGPCYVNMLQLLMLITGLSIYEHVITQQLISAIVIVRSARSLSSQNRCSACVHVTKQPSSEEWHIAVDPWSIVDACCFVNRDCVIIYHHAALDGNKLVQLRGLSRSVRWFKVRAGLNTLNHLKVIWSTEPICIIRYFWSVINSNKQRSNKTLVGAVIQTSDLQDRRRACYKLSHAASPCLDLYTKEKCYTTLFIYKMV